MTETELRKETNDLLRDVAKANRESAANYDRMAQAFERVALGLENLSTGLRAQGKRAEKAISEALDRSQVDHELVTLGVPMLPRRGAPKGKSGA